MPEVELSSNLSVRLDNYINPDGSLPSKPKKVLFLKFKSLSDGLYKICQSKDGQLEEVKGPYLFGLWPEETEKLIEFIKKED